MAAGKLGYLLEIVPIVPIMPILMAAAAPVIRYQ